MIFVYLLAADSSPPSAHCRCWRGRSSVTPPSQSSRRCPTRHAAVPSVTPPSHSSRRHPTCHAAVPLVTPPSHPSRRRRTRHVAVPPVHPVLATTSRPHLGSPTQLKPRIDDDVIIDHQTQPAMDGLAGRSVSHGSARVLQWRKHNDSSRNLELNGVMW